MNPKTLLTKTALTAGALGVLATAGAATASAASASTTQRHDPARVAYGSVELGSPLQYEQFLALQGFGRHHGTVDYTNWTYAEPGSGVYAPAGETAPGHVTTPIALTFTFKNTPYAHTLNGGLKLTALSPDKLAFSGTGFSGKNHLDDQRPGQGQQVPGHDRLRRSVLHGGHARYDRQRRVGVRHGTGLAGPGAHVHHARGVVYRRAALHRPDQVGPDAASQRELPVRHPVLGARPGRHRGDRQCPRRRPRPGE